MAMDVSAVDPESPRKRVKVSEDTGSAVAVPPISSIETPTPQAISAAPTAEGSTQDAQALKEAEVGITDFVSPDVSGFSGILKKRYTDFLVNEILPSGEVLHLRSFTAPKVFKQNTQSEKAASGAPQEKNDGENTKEKGDAISNGPEATKAVDQKNGTKAAAETSFQISDEDTKLLEELFGGDTTQNIISLHNRALASPKAKTGDMGRVKCGAVQDKDVRTKMHQAIRRIFSSRLESSTDKDGAMVIAAVPLRRQIASQQGRGDSRKGKLGWGELGGEYLHFTIYKENKDTMEIVSFLARQLKMQPKNFNFAGTKDRRGVTVQRACAFRVYADRLANVNKSIRSGAIGDFEYQPHGLELGDLNGNEFVITLRDCRFSSEIKVEGDDPVCEASKIVSRALANLRERGYFNYYGLQRFGTFATRTDTIGVRMLQGDFKGACDAILHYNAETIAAAKSDTKVLVSSDDIARAEAIEIFQATGRFSNALEKLPRKFSAEACIFRHLGRDKNDHFGALQTIPRNLRLMYVHAYQSLVWNFAVGERWRLYGDRVVAGDLVLVNEFKTDENSATAMENVDADGDEIVLPGAGDSAATADDMFERARALTAEEAASGTYTIFDIVLPLPGFDILYPPNEMTDFYKRFMGSEQGGNLDPFDMRRKWREISLSGSYRKILSRPGPDYSFEVKQYSADDGQFIQTDLETLRKKDVAGETPASTEAVPNNFSGDKLAVIIKFQLGSSQYATMALRELMKSGVQTYKPDFGAGR